ncbi:MAG: type-F conjugative transfer system secretin TraK [Colwellia sp.]|jgi:TraK protein.
MELKNIFALFVLMLAIPCIAAVPITPDTPTRVTFSNDNPNRLVCVSGLMNDIVSPSHIPKETKTIGKNAFYAYKMKPKSNGEIQYVDKSHDIYAVCDGQVYTLNVRQKNGRGRTIYLGDPSRKSIEENAKRLQEESIEDVMVSLFLDAYNNDLSTNYTVKKSSGNIKISDGVVAELNRTITLNGIGLRLKEYRVTSKSKINLYKSMFMKKEISRSLRLVGIVPEKASPGNPARLFIVENK